MLVRKAGGEEKLWAKAIFSHFFLGKPESRGQKFSKPNWSKNLKLAWCPTLLGIDQPLGLLGADLDPKFTHLPDSLGRSQERHLWQSAGGWCWRKAVFFPERWSYDMTHNS